MHKKCAFVEIRFLLNYSNVVRRVNSMNTHRGEILLPLA